jgi:hypothetical protein
MFLAQTVSILYRCRKVAKKKISKTSNMVAQKMYIVEDMRVLYNNTAHLVMRVDNSLTCEKRMTSFHKEERFGPIQLINPVTYFEMPLPNYKSQLSCVGGIYFASFYDFPIEFWKCSDSVVFLVLHFIFVLHETTIERLN